MNLYFVQDDEKCRPRTSYRRRKVSWLISSIYAQFKFAGKNCLAGCTEILWVDALFCNKHNFFP